MTKEEINALIKEYITENLDIIVTTSTRSEYMYGGGYEDIPTVEVEILLDGETICSHKS
ncbi:hypothetical protein XaC1_232 [Xanthomonas phage XaC1]|nr:hypothetical protein XaC1_232 [Xanthomonas phage XaC1]